MALIQATAMEMERLRQFVSLLANALRGQGFTPQSIKQIERSVRSKNPALTKKKEATEWKWKQKLEQQQKQTNNKTSSSSSSSSRPPSNTNTNNNKPSPSLLTDNNNNNSNAAKRPLSLKDNNNSKPSPSLLTDNNNNNGNAAKRPLSLKERMNALHEAKEQSTTSEKVEALKSARGLDEVKVTTTSKSNIASLFAEKIEKQKKSSSAASMTSSKGKILKEALTNPEPEKAAEVVESLGLFVAMEKTPDFKKKNGGDDDTKEEEEAPLEVLNMNNNVMMKKMSEKEKENMENLICDSLIKNSELKQVQMCNADINDDFLIKILDKLAANEQQHSINELWLESNPIGDKGMSALAKFIANDAKVSIIKLYSNKKTISTPILNELIEALEKNTTIVKFVFDGFRFQHQKDKKEKWLRRNAEIARKKRNEERKKLQAQQ
eukprot:CAMPEP_0197078928 /NCGR_PEP_ID=MMETSP1384-20130603/213366_1 /TAXON_ID=29189 /ORGANISM="Ammonia sp." /LENGTH=435 /DNA_ID=CAMNT_0042517797 /DNA_START=94 /DNA_END=1402 /DNA_ORIENTATION=-